METACYQTSTFPPPEPWTGTRCCVCVRACMHVCTASVYPSAWHTIRFVRLFVNADVNKWMRLVLFMKHIPSSKFCLVPHTSELETLSFLLGSAGENLKEPETMNQKIWTCFPDLTSGEYTTPPQGESHSSLTPRAFLFREVGPWVDPPTSTVFAC